MKVKGLVIEEMAKVGYETMFEDKWNDLHYNSIEKVMWRTSTEAMLDKLRELWRKNEEN